MALEEEFFLLRRNCCVLLGDDALKTLTPTNVRKGSLLLYSHVCAESIDTSLAVCEFRRHRNYLALESFDLGYELDDEFGVSIFKRRLCADWLGGEDSGDSRCGYESEAQSDRY